MFWGLGLRQGLGIRFKVVRMVLYRFSRFCLLGLREAETRDPVDIPAVTQPPPVSTVAPLLIRQLQLHDTSWVPPPTLTGTELHVRQ